MTVPLSSIMSHNHRLNHIRNFLTGRRVTFRASIIIHDIIHIPIVCGEVAIRWRFYQAQSIHPGEQAPSIVKKKAEETSSGSIEDVSEGNSSRDDHTATIISSSSSSTDSSTSHLRVPRHSSGESSYGKYLSPETAAVITNGADEDVEVPDTFLSSTKGRTSWNPILHDHSVSFNQRIDVDIEMFVDKETRALQECELKLEALLDMPNSDAKPRGPDSLGIIYIDLAQYAKAGADTRRHFLQKSKTNAIMRVSIELTQTGGESNFVTPELPAAQLFSGVSGLLDRERGLVGSGAIQLRSFSGPHSSDSSFLHTPSRPSTMSRNPSRRGLTDSLGPSSLPAASTEAIINALFNPFPSSSLVASPFTIPAPPRSNSSAASTFSQTDSDSFKSEPSGLPASRPSFDGPTASNHFSASAKISLPPTQRGLTTDGASSSKVGRWFHKLGTPPRPGTPTKELLEQQPLGVIGRSSTHATKAHDFAKPSLTR